MPLGCDQSVLASIQECPDAEGGKQLRDPCNEDIQIRLSAKGDLEKLIAQRWL